MFVKKWVIGFLILFTQSEIAHGKDLRLFVQNCAWGTATGATLGFVSLVFSDRPSESWNNVAKGASLGLYGGIGYGLFQINKESKTEGQIDFSLLPRINEGYIEGFEVVTNIISF